MAQAPAGPGGPIPGPESPRLQNRNPSRLPPELEDPLDTGLGLGVRWHWPGVHTGYPTEEKGRALKRPDFRLLAAGSPQFRSSINSSTLKLQVVSKSSVRHLVIRVVEFESFPTNSVGVCLRRDPLKVDEDFDQALYFRLDAKM